MLRPVVEAAPGLCFLQFFVEEFEELLVLRAAALGLHVDLELDVPDERDVGVELEGRQDGVALELCSLALLVVVVPALHQRVLLRLRFPLLLLLLFLLEQAHPLALADLLLQPLADLLLLLLVLLDAQAQDLLNVLVLAAGLEVHDIALAEAAEVVEADVREGVVPAAPEDKSLLDDQLVPDQLVLLELEHALLNRLLRHQPVDCHRPRLPDAVGAVHRLHVVLRVPVNIVEDHAVGSDQIEAEAAGAGRDEKDGVLGVVVEPADGGIALFERIAAVNPAVPVALAQAVLAEQIEHDHELREDEDLVLLGDELGHQLVHHAQLARVRDHPLVLLHSREEVGVLADLARHHNVEVGGRDIAEDVAEAQEVAVHAQLQPAEGHEDGELGLVRQAEVEVLLDAALEEGLDDVVEALGHAALVLEAVVLRALEALDALLDALEHVRLVKDVGHDEVEQSPELLQVVVERRARQQQPEGRLQVVQALEVLRLEVLDLVRLVHDQRLPLDARQRPDAYLRPLVVRDYDVELLRPQHLLHESFPRLCVRHHHLHARTGEPLGELARPVAGDGLGANNEVLAEDAVLLLEVGKVGDGLDGLAEAHIVGEDAVGVLRGKVDHPLERLELVALELAADQQGGLRDLEVAAVLVQEVQVGLRLHRLPHPPHQLLQHLQSLLLAQYALPHSNIIPKNQN